MKKKLVMIAGPAGVGKTAVCKELFRRIDGCAWLDGDWCWMVHPYPGKTEEQKRYAEKAFGYILDGYFQDANTHTIFFSWMIQADFMFKLVTDRIAYADYQLIKVVLVCEGQEHRRRMIADARTVAQIAGPVDMDQYRRMTAVQIDTTGLSISETADRIQALLG